jgi:hypothetical protein
MIMRKSKNSKSLALLVAAAAVAVPAIVNAAPVVTITSLGTPTNTAGNITLTGYTAYDISITASSGNTISAVNAAGTFGLFGPFLQRFAYTPGTTGSTPTPPTTTSTPLVPGGKNQGNAAQSFDSHFLSATALPLSPPSEDSNDVNPGSPVPASGTTAGTFHYGTGTKLQYNGSFATLTGNLDFAYVILKNGTTATYDFNISDFNPGTASASVFELTGSFPNAGPVTNKIISLTNAVPSGYGSSQGTITVPGSTATGYQVGSVHVATAGGVATGYVQESGIAAGDTEIYALNIKVAGSDPSTAQDQALATNIGTSNVGGVTAVAFADASPALQALFPGYDIIVTKSGGLSNPAFLGWDFTSTDASVAGVTVTDVAAVPEPASAAGLMIGAAGLLLGRKKRQAA